MTKRMIVWRIDPKTKVPTELIDAELKRDEDGISEFSRLLTDDYWYAIRIEKGDKNEKP